MDFENLQADVNLIMNKHYTPGRAGKIDKVVIHHNAGNLTVEDCYRVWQTREASAHYQVETSGRIGQLVNDWDTAWHAGSANPTSIGIEHANDGGDDWTVSPACLESGAHLVAAICRYYGLGRPAWKVNVFPHSYFNATACPGALQGSQLDAYMARAQQWYDAMGGGTAPSAPPSAPTPKPAPSAPASKVTIRYGLHVLGDGWLDEVTDFGSGNEGFAGLPFYSHDLLYAKVDRGQLRYRAHTREDGWLDWVYKGDRNDTVNGCAGILCHAIDGVQAYYTTPEGEEFQQVWYRSQTTQREGWLAVCCDDGTSVDSYDGWAGMYGEPLDRLQMAIGTRNPF